MRSDRIQGPSLVGDAKDILRVTVAGRGFDVFLGKAFTPTDTTRLLIEHSLPLIVPSARVLDLGCGTGVVALVLSQLKSLPMVYLSDVHEESAVPVRVNFERMGQQLDFRCGDLFEPWKGEVFDLIVDDVSGVAEDIARSSRWFSGVPCDSGDDGTELVRRVISQAKGYLRPNGRLIFPIISLSNTERILASARSEFLRVTRLGAKEWPLPKEVQEKKELLESLEVEGKITLVRKYGMLLGRTEIYLAETGGT